MWSRRHKNRSVSFKLQRPAPERDSQDFSLKNHPGPSFLGPPSVDFSRGASCRLERVEDLHDECGGGDVWSKTPNGVVLMRLAPEILVEKTKGFG